MGKIEHAFDEGELLREQASGQVVVHFEPLRHMECAYYVAGTLRATFPF